MKCVFCGKDHSLVGSLFDSLSICDSCFKKKLSDRFKANGLTGEGKGKGIAQLKILDDLRKEINALESKAV